MCVQRKGSFTIWGLKPRRLHLQGIQVIWKKTVILFNFLPSTQCSVKAMIITQDCPSFTSDQWRPWPWSSLRTILAYQCSMESTAIAQGCPGLPVSEWWMFLKGFGWEDWQCLQVFPGILITRKKHRTVISDCHLKRHPVRLSRWRHPNSYYRTLVSVTH